MVHPRLPSAVCSPLLAVSTRRQVANAVRPSSTLAPHVAGYSVTTNSDDNFRESRIAGLRQALLKAGNSSRVWAHYTNILNYFNYDALTVELHQQVLRQCSPPASTLRITAPHGLLLRGEPENPHHFEGRFQTVISNIRALGSNPTLEDYHFILEQFAAVGHHVGSIQVYQEILNLGLTPEPKTYGLCLQSIARRLSLPIKPVFQPRLIAQTRKTLEDLMADMRKYQISFTQPNLDLALRIFKETVDEEGFSTLVKWTYGIDLSNPDCPPLELLENSIPSSVQPFSTHALNTILDTLGRFGNISKLVQAFEVLTQPLPRAKQHQFSSFDDDDDFGVPVEVSTPPNYSLPYATPNTTSYNILLYHIGQAEHAVLARHYLIQAMQLDREVNQKLYWATYLGKPIEEIPAPQFSINRRMLLSVFGHTNRDKNLGLMRWLWTKMPWIQRSKRNDLHYYTDFRERLTSHDFEPSIMKQSPDQPVPEATVDKERLESTSPIDLDNQHLLGLPTEEKMFDLDLHIRILERDVEEIAAFAMHLDEIVGRTTQRKKEQLGRRVWGGKDIYLSIDDKRKLVSRERWREIVHFRPRHDIHTRLQRQGTRSDSNLRDIVPHLQYRRSFSTRALESNQYSLLGPMISKIQTWLPS
ncbi:hypothetical protein AN958_07874 [Leucoagaricus sp. SymC.cos]|nr:hypothetical protein AN958_07874 [Leucoagaricus sp. SymC.cos]